MVTFDNSLKRVNTNMGSISFSWFIPPRCDSDFHSPQNNPHLNPINLLSLSPSLSLNEWMSFHRYLVLHFGSSVQSGHPYKCECLVIAFFLSFFGRYRTGNDLANYSRIQLVSYCFFTSATQYLTDLFTKQGGTDLFHAFVVFYKGSINIVIFQSENRGFEFSRSHVHCCFINNGSKW